MSHNIEVSAPSTPRRSPVLLGPLAGIAALVLLLGCSGDDFVNSDGGVSDGSVVSQDGPVVSKDGPVTHKDGSVVNKDGRVTRKDGPVTRKDGRVTHKDGPAPSPDQTPWPADKGPGPSKLPPPPAGAVLLRFSVDDSTSKTYAGGELLLKGQFKYQRATNVITFDAGWSGPFVPLWDDGPAGREGPGSTAGDHKLGALVYMVPCVARTLEYGLLSPAGWMWPNGGNMKVTVKPGDPPKVLSGYKVPPRRGVDLQVEVDNRYLWGVKVRPGSDAVTVHGTFSHWAPMLCGDKGTGGDAVAGDHKYTGRLSAQVGRGRRFPHLGLLQPGQKVRFHLKLGSSTYARTNGLVVRLLHAGGSRTVPLSPSGTELTFTVPSGLGSRAAPPPETRPLPSGSGGNPRAGLFKLPSSLKIGGFYYLPQLYDAHRPLPLLVALHGAFEQGQWMVKHWRSLAEEWGFILLAPSSMAKSWDLKAVFYPTPGDVVDEEQPILDAVTWLRGRYRVKTGQIGVEGFSDGASMTLYMATTHRNLFCVGMPNSAGGMGNNYARTGSPRPAIYQTHGDADKVLPVSGARRMVKKLKAAGYKVTYVEFPGVGHVFPSQSTLPMLDFFSSNAR